MLRWKLFVPLAVALTLLGMMGSKYWSASASHRQISALQQASSLKILEKEDQVIIHFPDQKELPDVLADLDSRSVEMILADKDLKFVREQTQPIEAGLARQTDLIVAEGVATKEYFQASLQLLAMAEKSGYSSALVIWGERLVAEVGDSEHSYIVQQPMGVNP
jgi:hypothetical protein